VVGTIPIILVAAFFVLVVGDRAVDATKLTLEVIVLRVTSALGTNTGGRNSRHGTGSGRMGYGGRHCLA
jgi:hypothetical protein